MMMTGLVESRKCHRQANISSAASDSISKPLRTDLHPQAKNHCSEDRPHADRFRTSISDGLPTSRCMERVWRADNPFFDWMSFSKTLRATPSTWGSISNDADVVFRLSRRREGEMSLKPALGLYLALSR